jgi:DNA-binding transcriptional regulator YiaG
VSVATLGHWELGRTAPATRFLPAIFRFLGCDPRPLGENTFPERLRVARTARGLSQEALARRLGIDPTTVWRWEAGRGCPGARLSKLLLNALTRQPFGPDLGS